MFAQMMGGEAGEAHQEEPVDQYVPAAPRAPESIIVHDTPTRRDTAQQFADLFSLRGF